MLVKRKQLMTPNFDWIPDEKLKTEIIQAWEDYDRCPEVQRLYRYLQLVESVPLESDDFYMKSHTRFDDSHQPSPLDHW